MISWNFKTHNLQPIGLDIGHNFVKMIQLTVSGGRMSVRAADKVAIDPNTDGDQQAVRQDVVSAVRQMLARGNFRGREVVSCLPNDKVKITSLRIAETELNQVEHVLRKEVVQRFGLNPDKDAIDYVVAGSIRQGDETKKELILFAVDDQTIKDHITLLEEARLQPVAIDTTPFALFRAFVRRQRREVDKEHTIVFVDVGSRFTTVVFGRGDEISFVKQIPIGGQSFNREIARMLGIDIGQAKRLRERIRTERKSTVSDSSEQPDEEEGKLDASARQTVVDAVSSIAEELAREISLCLRYFTVTFRGKRVERAIFSGGEAYENILLNVLRRQLTVEIEVAQPLRGYDLSSEREHLNLAADRRGALCEWAVAVGLSLKGLNETPVGAKA